MHNEKNKYIIYFPFKHMIILAFNITEICQSENCWLKMYPFKAY